MNLSDHFRQAKAQNSTPCSSKKIFANIDGDGPYQTSTPTLQLQTVHEVPNVSPLPSGSQSSDPDSDDLKIESWFLPPPVERYFKTNNLSTIFEWQRDCLKTDGVLNGKNLIFSAPTSAGKTLVADILMLKQVFENRKKVLVILPFVSIAREKMLTLQSMLKDTHVRVGGFMGTHHAKGGIDGVDIAISTIEKANNIILKLIQEKTLDKLGGIIVDELHLIGDISRGYLLELLLTKVMFVCEKFNYNIQIVGMSATLPNLSDLGTWLKASVFTTDFRPVPLLENIKIGRTVYETSTMKQVAYLNSNMYEKEEDDVVFLTVKTILDGFGVIIFWNDKAMVENLALKTANRIKALNAKGDATNRRVKIDEEKIEKVMAQMKGCSIKEDQKLVAAIKYGIGFHHGGLCMEQREIVEDAFRNGSLRALVATSTLSSGVNLPARRVIIRQPCIYGDKMMDVMMYRQMIGRAGRKGIDEKGESYLLCTEKQGDIGKKLVASTYPPVSSCLSYSHDEPHSSLKRLILEAIVTELICSVEDAQRYVNSTLLSCDSEEEKDLFQIQVTKAMDYLTQFKFITVDGGKVKPTQLGRAVVASSLSPEDGLKLLNELLKARRGFVLNCDLHILYQIIPESIIRERKIKTDVMRQVFDDINDKPEFEYYQDVWAALKINPTSLYAYQTEYVEHPIPDASTFKRLFIALALNEIIEEHPIEDLEMKYHINRATLQSLQNTVSTFAGMIEIFCNKLGWNNLEFLVNQFQSRLEFGVQRELIDLMRIETLNAALARQLYDSNFDTVATIAHSTPAEILKVFNEAKSFESSSPRRGLQNIVWIQSKRCSMTLEEISQAIVMETREIMERDVGRSINWETPEYSSSSEPSELSPESSFEQQPPLMSFKTPQTPKVAKKKSPRKLMSRKELNKIDRQVRRSVRSTSLGEHSISIDTSILEALHEPLEVILPHEHGTVSTSQSSSLSTPTKSSSPTSSEGDDEEPIQPRLLFTPEKILATKRTLSPSTSFEALKRSKILIQSVPNCVKTEPMGEDDTQDLGVSIEQIIKLEPFIKSSVTPDSKYSKCLASDAIGYESIVKQWKMAGVMSVEVDVETNPLPSKIGQRHGADLFKKGVEDALNFDNDRRKLNRILVCFGSTRVTIVTGRQHLLDFSKILAKFLSKNSEEYLLIVFDILKVYRVFRECFGISKDNLANMKWFDVRIVHWLNDPEGDPDQRRNTHDLVQGYLPEFASLSKKKNLSLYYSTAFLFPLAIKMEHMLKEMNMTNIFENIETVASLVLAEIEYTGIGLDVEGIETVKSRYDQLLKEMKDKADSLAGKSLNLNSPQQISQVLYYDLNLLSNCYDLIDKNPIRVEKLRRRQKLPEHLRTNKEMLEKLRPFHPLPGLVIEYRKLNYAIKLMNSILMHARKSDDGLHRVCGRIETFLATGRISMDHPNIMGTARNFEITSLSEPVKIDLRKHFVPKPGYVFLSADYSQLELRILAHFSSDPSLLQALNSGKDVFKSVAASIHCKEVDEITDEERAQAKAICYGIVYGMGTKKLSEDLGVTEEEAKEFRNIFLESFPGIDTFLEKVVDECRQEEIPHIKTLVGRLRLLPLMKGNSDDQAKAKRQAVNSTIQGSASDLIKLAMIKLENIIQTKRLDAQLVLQMHDELIFEVKREFLNEFACIVSTTMEKTDETNFPIELKVKLTVNLKYGDNWSQLNELKLSG